MCVSSHNPILLFVQPLGPVIILRSKQTPAPWYSHSLFSSEVGRPQQCSFRQHTNTQEPNQTEKQAVKSTHEHGGMELSTNYFLKYFLDNFPPFTFVLQRWTLSLGIKSLVRICPLAAADQQRVTKTEWGDMVKLRLYRENRRGESSVPDRQWNVKHTNKNFLTTSECNLKHSHRKSSAENGGGDKTPSSIFPNRCQKNLHNKIFIGTIMLYIIDRHVWTCPLALVPPVRLVCPKLNVLMCWWNHVIWWIFPVHLWQRLRLAVGERRQERIWVAHLYNREHLCFS